MQKPRLNAPLRLIWSDSDPFCHNTSSCECVVTFGIQRTWLPRPQFFDPISKTVQHSKWDTRILHLHVHKLIHVDANQCIIISWFIVRSPGKTCISLIRGTTHLHVNTYLHVYAHRINMKACLDKPDIYKQDIFQPRYFSYLYSCLQRVQLPTCSQYS